MTTMITVISLKKNLGMQPKDSLLTEVSKSQLHSWTREPCSPWWLPKLPRNSSEMICLNTASNEPSLLETVVVSCNCCQFCCLLAPFKAKWSFFHLYFFHLSHVVGRKSIAPLQLSTLPQLLFFLRAQGNSIWPFTQPCFRNIGLEASLSWKMEKGAIFCWGSLKDPGEKINDELYWALK